MLTLAGLVVVAFGVIWLMGQDIGMSAHHIFETLFPQAHERFAAFLLSNDMSIYVHETIMQPLMLLPLWQASFVVIMVLGVLAILLFKLSGMGRKRIYR